MPGDDTSSAFTHWAPPGLEALPCMPAVALAPLPQLTPGLAALMASCRADGGGGSGAAAAREAATLPGETAKEPAGGWTLPDGRLRAGTHLPLLARRYRYLGLVGDGGSAQVVLAQDGLRQGAPPVVLKIMRRHLATAGQKEARVLRFLSTALPPAAAVRIVSLRGAFHFKGHYVLVLERLHGSLLDYIVSTASAPPAARLAALRKIAQQLLTGVEAMHARGIVHADLKPDNILLTRPPGEAGVGVKLADFGSCFAAAGVDTARLSFELQTLSYRAPEVVNGSAPVGPAADMWSLGCILAEVALQRPLFPAHNSAGLLRQILAALEPDSSAAANGETAAAAAKLAPVPPAGAAAATGLVPQCGELCGWHLGAPALLRELATLDRGLADLVSRLLVVDPAARLPALSALQHSFLHPLTPVAAIMRAAAAAADEAPAAASRAATQPVAQQTQPPLRPAPRRGLPAAAAAATAAKPDWQVAQQHLLQQVGGATAAAQQHRLQGLRAGLGAAPVAALETFAAQQSCPAFGTAAVAAAVNQLQATPPEAASAAAAMIPEPADRRQGENKQSPQQRQQPTPVQQPPSPEPATVKRLQQDPSSCTAAAAGSPPNPADVNPAAAAAAWQELGPLIDEVTPGLPARSSHNVDMKTPSDALHGQQQQQQLGPAAGSVSSSGRGSSRGHGSGNLAAQPPCQAPAHGDAAAALVPQRSDDGSDDTATAAHSAAVAALAALATSVPPRPRQQQRRQQQQPVAAGTGSRKRNQQPGADAAAPTAYSAAKQQPAVAKRARTSQGRAMGSPARGSPATCSSGPKGGSTPAAVKPEAPATAGATDKASRQAPKAVAAAAKDDVPSTLLEDTPQRSLRDRQSISDKKPWWQV